MDSSPKPTNGTPEGATAGAPHEEATTMELCPRCGTEYCVGCGNSDLNEGECPTCSKALTPADPE